MHRRNDHGLVPRDPPGETWPTATPWIVDTTSDLGVPSPLSGRGASDPLAAWAERQPLAAGHTVCMIKRQAALPTALVVVAVLATSCSSTAKPHGDPDPGGTRLAGLPYVARAVMPPTAASTHLTLTKSTWGHGGCDGGPPGWTPMQAVQTFEASGGVVAQIDANMERLNWRVVSQTNAAPSGQYPPSAAPGPNAPYVREYQSSSDPSAPVAWLYTPAQAGGPYWQLALEVVAANVPDHAC